MASTTAQSGIAALGHNRDPGFVTGSQDLRDFFGGRRPDHARCDTPKQPALLFEIDLHIRGIGDHPGSTDNRFQNVQETIGERD